MDPIYILLGYGGVTMCLGGAATILLAAKHDKPLWIGPGVVAVVIGGIVTAIGITGVL